MDWQTINFDWNRVRAFLITAEEGSLTAAARVMGTTQPTLGRQVSALEDELGAVLFDRVGGKLVLTDNGKILLEHVRVMGEAAGHVSRLADGQSSDVRGKISISASEVYCAFVLPPIIERLRAQEPGISIEIVADNKPSDLNRREADIALRNFRPIEEDLIARKVRDDLAYLYATPNYLTSIGNPSTLAEFGNASFISFTEPALIMDWLNRAGLTLTSESFPIVTENYLVHWEFVKRGLGIGIMPEARGDQESQVVRACPMLAPFEFPVWLVSHRELKTSRRVRIVFDLLAEMLSG
ncbi:MAG: DNA-binding transcriptional LysR family regulator [Flavobacteriaceae bacterium]|jgi:DNA-binding transcriptional LysR family regulator